MNQPRSIRPVIRGILLDIAPPLIAYYGLRAAGFSEYVALLTATVLAGVKVVHDAIRARRLDPFAGYLMLNFGLSLAVGLSTSDPRLLLAGNTLIGGVGGLIFLVSCVAGRPLTQIVAERVQSQQEASGPGAAEYRRRVHVLLSAMWGVGLIVGAAIHLAVIYSTSVDVANAATSVLSLAATGLLMTATVVIAKRARERWDQRATVEREQSNDHQG
ncbi:MAG: VC0807 family protein [Mycobacterium sp.]